MNMNSLKRTMPVPQTQLLLNCPILLQQPHRDILVENCFSSFVCVLFYFFANTQSNEQTFLIASFS